MERQKLRQDALAAAVLFPAFGWWGVWLVGEELQPLAWGLTALGIACAVGFGVAAWRAGG